MDRPPRVCLLPKTGRFSLFSSLQLTRSPSPFPRLPPWLSASPASHPPSWDNDVQRHLRAWLPPEFDCRAVESMAALNRLRADYSQGNVNNEAGKEAWLCLTLRKSNVLKGLSRCFFCGRPLLSLCKRWRNGKAEGGTTKKQAPSHNF